MCHRKNHLKNRLIFFFSLLLLYGVAIPQEAIEVGRIDLTKNVIDSEFEPNRLVKIPNGLIFLDTQNRRIGSWVSDTLLIKGGFGAGESGLFDPVDIVSHQLDVFILDRTENRISRFDVQLNFIQSISFAENDGGLFPTSMGNDSRGWLYFYSPETHQIYRSNPNSSQLNTFIDLNSFPRTEDCVASMRFGRNDQLALLYNCINEIHLFSRTGKMERRFKVNIENPALILPFQKFWVILNETGDIQFIGETPFALDLNDALRDAIVDGDFLNVLTDKELIIFDINVPK
ncbi:MAG: hypothetical protein HOF82_08390 [Candidatus Marinimicrobia bacterium]|nr:hypothetical protein [Candidatus Neomarinimicrobiota bacterium]MBT6418584.1 hypothetical protein [Candidatus Neomarinimicrobiota bacterium]